MPSNPTIFDRQLLRARRERARMQGPETFLIDRVAVELGERLSAVLRTFERAVDLGTPTDAVARALAGSDKIASLVAAAPYDAPLRVAADEEICPSPRLRSIWSSRRWRCNSSMICPAR